MESFFTSCITVWYRSTTKPDRDGLERFRAMAQKIIRCNLLSISDIHHSLSL